MKLIIPATPHPLFMGEQLTGVPNHWTRWVTELLPNVQGKYIRFNLFKRYNFRFSISKFMLLKLVGSKNPGLFPDSMSAGEEIFTNAGCLIQRKLPLILTLDRQMTTYPRVYQPSVETAH